MEGKQSNRQRFHRNISRLLHGSLWESLKVVGRSLVLLLPQERESLWCHWPASLPCVLHFLTLVVPLNIKFTSTQNVTQSIYLYKLISISLLLMYWEAPLIVLTSYFLQSTMLQLYIFSPPSWNILWYTHLMNISKFLLFPKASRLHVLKPRCKIKREKGINIAKDIKEKRDHDCN